MSFAPRPDEVLGIDLEAELQLLISDQLQGTWLIPAELARLALAAGARAVDIRSGRRQWWMGADEAGLRTGLVEALAAVLDRARPAGGRQAAIAEVEAAGALPILWAAGAARSVEVRCLVEGEELRLVLERGRAPRISSAAVDPRLRRLEVTVSGPRFDLGRARWWLAAACRFATVPIRLDGDRLPEGVEGGLYRQRIDRPLPGQLLLAADGDAPRLWLLRHGVVASRATVPGYPPFHAAVELGAETLPAASGADLRAAVTPRLPALIDGAVRLMVWAGRRMADRQAAVRRRIRGMLLEAADRGLRRHEILAVPLVEAYPTSRDGSPRLASLAELSERGRDGALVVIDPDEDVRRLAPSGQIVYRLDPEERRLVRALTGVELERPASPPRDRAALRQVTIAILAAAARFRRMATWLLNPRGGALLERESLSPEERVLVEELDALLGDGGSAVMVDARGWPVWQAERQRLVLPRRSREVRRGLRAVSVDVAWAWPVLVAAMSPADPPPAARARWRRMLDLRAGQAPKAKVRDAP